MYRHWGSVQAVWPIKGVEVQLCSFMTTALEGGEGSASRPGRSLPPGKTWYPFYRGWMGSRVGLDRCGKSRPTPGFDPQTVQPVASRYTDWAIPAHSHYLTYSHIHWHSRAASHFIQFTNHISQYLPRSTSHAVPLTQYLPRSTSHAVPQTHIAPLVAPSHTLPFCVPPSLMSTQSSTQSYSSVILNILILNARWENRKTRIKEAKPS